jgi:hypothetical protein
VIQEAESGCPKRDKASIQRKSENLWSNKAKRLAISQLGEKILGYRLAPRYCNGMEGVSERERTGIAWIGVRCLNVSKRHLSSPPP